MDGDGRAGRREARRPASPAWRLAGAHGSCESSGARVERAFDAAGHLVRTRRLQDVAGPEGDTCRWVEERYTYNAREQLVSIERSHLADPSTPGAVLTGLRGGTELHCDEHGRLSETIALADAHGPVVTSYRYDPAGRPAGTTTGAEAERTVGYDALSRVVFQSDGDEGVWEGRYWALETFADLGAFTSALAEHGFTEIEVEDVSYRLAPSVLHIPRVTARFLWDELRTERLRMSQVRWGHVRASLLSPVVGMARKRFGYFLITASR